MHYFRNFRKLSTPFIFLAVLFNINPKLSEVRANNKIIPANDIDLNLYRNMGITYLCSTSTNGTDSEFEKSLVVAANLFSTVIQQKHGGFIKEGNMKEQKIEPRILVNNIIFQLIGGALTICPVNVPESMGEAFKNQYDNKIKELNKK
tara:strand:- start:163 stop:606 length:444 start_codon:yes stop_codon:yes gene_type:complete